MQNNLLAEIHSKKIQFPKSNCLPQLPTEEVFLIRYFLMFPHRMDFMECSLGTCTCEHRPVNLHSISHNFPSTANKSREFIQSSPSSYYKKEQHHGPVPKRTRIEGTAVNKE